MEEKYMKRYPLRNVKNVRDLGGVPTLDGKVTKWGKFIRAASLDDSKDDDLAYLKKLGVTAIIDLRREGEINPKLSSIEKIKEEFDYYNISLAGDREFRKEDIERIIKKEVSIGRTYINLIDNYKAIRQIMEVFANNDGVSLFHCQEGKDRTGIISMILMGLSDVGRSDIIADYEISSALLGYIERYDEDDELSIFRITSPYNMREAYDYILRKYKTFDDYLLYAKVDRCTIDKIREKLAG
ncbi:tyrosine-protein phosphatase [Anaerococcus tetradius]|jgi:hypothetical protein|uniref:Tyrosine specific protein phosphatases domain-containing protein n=2 Tax=Anaerococcus tetradius TaxID=33036 RepID=C2CH66_9FIRM|nr:tyrosine-protein phosphatase [Anaerococcus tetradius]EEI83132.1 hypothetical protein HMPREF0077_0826 [Anaerococcus tetradius ATCC 35098]KWZ77994.1 hypothetical protein HMPREF3200_01043 [Anaerococcus tetradius]